ncbi:MAG: histidyl-tRNA synthetase [Planctomycetota bacterium]|jgi:histidyl-tRNA synthetase
MEKIKAALPKGFRDFLPEQTAKRNYISQTIQSVFEKYGFQGIETPVMENLKTLTGKYSDEVNKLLFKTLNSGDFLTKADANLLAEKNSAKVANQISEKGMRYDLTVPLARYVVQHENDLVFPFKRFHIAPVWRADRPQRGRYREFYQCDVDTIGSKSLINEVEFAQIYNEAFERLNLKVNIKINSRKILVGMIEAVDASDKATTIITIIDKIDKIGLDKVIDEVSKLGLSEEQTSKLKDFLSTTDINKIELSNDTLKEGVAEVQFILKHQVPNVSFDISLARGADYYTGVILEVFCTEMVFGALGGGGRYDNLTEMFGKKDVTGVGISFGFERVYDVLESLNKFPENIQSAPTLLFLHFGEKEQEFGFGLLQKVRKENISSELYPDQAKMKKQMKYANGKGVKYICVIGSNEMESGELTLKNMETGNQESLTIEEIIEKLK